MKVELKQSSVIAILIYHVIFINLKYINGYGALKYMLLSIVSIFLFLKIKMFMKKKYFKTNLILISFCLSIVVSAIFNKDVYENRSFLTGIFNALAIMNIFLFFEYLDCIKKVKSGINIFYRLTLFYTIITDIFIFFIPKMFLNSNNYFLGNKFDVSYIHILLLILFFQKSTFKIRENNRIKLKVCLIVILTICVSIKVECSTGLIGALIVIILMILSNIKVIRTLLVSAKIMLLSLVISDTILLIGTSILSNKYINYFIINILNKDITLTGRMRIYEGLSSVIKENLILGYGYGNSYFVLMNKIGNAPNAQNGILESVINYGAVGTVLMVLLMYFSMKGINNKTEFYPIVILIYMYIFLSSVEITLGITILPLFSILNISSKKNILLR